MALIHKKSLSESSESPLGPPDLKVHESIADTLRLARQEHGQDLRTVAQVLRIRHVYLEAIENGDFEQLPGAAYAIGFLRTYAEFLGLDGEQIVERYKGEVQGAEPKLDLVFPEPVGHNRIPGGAIVLISVVLLGLTYGGWFYLSNEGKSVADLMPSVPKDLQAMFAGDDDGQGAAPPEAAASAPDGTLDAAPPAYSPPESAEAESETRSETADPAIAADIEPPAPTATTELAAPDIPAPAADIEASQDAAAVPIAVAAIDSPLPEVVEAFDSPASEAVAAIEIPAPEIVATTETLPSETMTESAEAPAPPAPPPAPAPPTIAEPKLSPATGDSFLALAAVAAPVSQATTDSAGSVEPMLDETVVIPAPPTATRDLVLSTARLPRVYGESNLGTRVVLRAVQDSWVQVRDRQDALLLTRVLRSGDTYYVPSQDGLTLLTGNAGGIVIEVDGVTVAPLGPVGAVRRQIALDPAGLLDGTAQQR
ncbi:MAG: helix-turn-helix domain-containing protein [Alphaproteobacteria bacterium]